MTYRKEFDMPNIREQVVQLLHELTALNLGINDFEECSKIVARFIKE